MPDDDLKVLRDAVRKLEEGRAADAEALARAVGKSGSPPITRASTSARMVAGYERSGTPAEQRAKRRALDGEFGPNGNEARDEGDDDGDDA